MATIPDEVIEAAASSPSASSRLPPELRAKLPPPDTLWSDEPQMESKEHYSQLALLVSCIEEVYWRDRQDFFIGANMSIFYDPEEILQQRRKFIGPDFFLVRNVSGHMRKSWVLWDEDYRFPNLIMELLSESTASVDRNQKKALYQDIFHCPECFWFSPRTQEFAGFRLHDEHYQAISPNEQGWCWSEQLQLYLGVVGEWLRYFDASGTMIPTAGEAAMQAQHQAKQAQYQAEQAQHQAKQAQYQAEQAQYQAEQEHRRAEALAAKLRELGVDPAQLK